MRPVVWSAILLLALVVSGCRTSVDVRVVEYETGRPIEGASVHLQYNKWPFNGLNVVKTTDADGRVRHRPLVGRTAGFFVAPGESNRPLWNTYHKVQVLNLTRRGAEGTGEYVALRDDGVVELRVLREQPIVDVILPGSYLGPLFIIPHADGEPLGGVDGVFTLPLPTSGVVLPAASYPMTATPFVRIRSEDGDHCESESRLWDYEFVFEHERRQWRETPRFRNPFVLETSIRPPSRYIDAEPGGSIALWNLTPWRRSDERPGGYIYYVGTRRDAQLLDLLMIRPGRQQPYEDWRRCPQDITNAAIELSDAHAAVEFIREQRREKGTLFLSHPNLHLHSGR